MAFTGCSSDPEVAPEVQPIQLELIAGNTTRTEIGPDNKITWSESGETLKILEKVDAAALSALDNNGYTKDAASGKASFTVALPAKTGTSFHYATLHPKGAYASSSNTDFAAIKFVVPEIQLPTTTSFDPDADILASKTIVTDAQPTSLSLQFARIVALGKMQLTDLAVETDETVSDITFTAPGKVVTGRGKFNFDTGNILTDQWGYSGQSKEYVSMLYDDVSATATFDAWFSCAPFSVGANETFTVEVVTSRGTYTRTVTIPADGSLNFTLGDLTTFSVNMSSADFTPAVTDPSVFTITFGATHPGVSNNRVDYSPSLDLGVTGSSASSLTFDFSTPKEAIRSTNAFSGYDGASGTFGWWSATNTTMTLNDVALNGKTAFALTFAAGASTSTSTIQASISKDGTHFFPLSQSAVAVDTKISGSELLKTVNFNLNAALTDNVSIKFENTSSQGCKLDDIKLMPLDAPAADSYPIDWKAAPALTTTPDDGGALSFAADNGSGAAPESQTIEYAWEGDDCTLTFKKADADTWYTVTQNDNGNGTGTLTIQPDQYTATDADRTGKVTIALIKNSTPAITHVITITQKAAGATTITYVEATTTDDITDGEYIFIGEFSGTSYYLPTTPTTTRPVSSAIPSSVIFSGNTISSPTSDMTWTFTTSGDGFIITSTADPTQALGCINNNNGLSIGNSYSNHIWTLSKVSANYGWSICDTKAPGSGSSISPRYMAIYNATNWRTYGGTGTNQNGTFRIFKKQ